MTRSLRIAAFLAVVFLACGGGASAGTAGREGASRVHFVIAANNLAGLRMGLGTSDHRVLRYFGRLGWQGSSSIRGDSCSLRIKKVGLTAGFSAPVGHSATAVNCTLLPGDVEVHVSRWHTANGLHIGDTTATLHRLFPKARSGGRTGSRAGYGIPSHAAVWQLANTGSHVARLELVGYLRRGRVITLGIETVGH